LISNRRFAILSFANADDQLDQVVAENGNSIPIRRGHAPFIIDELLSKVN
jgi:hypothetical protein